MKGYKFLTSAKTIAKNLSTNLSKKYSQNLLDQVKKSATDALTITSKRAITSKKEAETTDHLICNKISNKST